MEKGCENLDKHIENVRDKFGLPVVVAINRFPTDDVEELEFLKKHCDDMGAVSYTHLCTERKAQAYLGNCEKHRAY